MEIENDKNRIVLNKRKFSKSDPNAWIEIGTLKHAIIYPIDGGAGCPQDHSTKVYFSKYGLSNTLETVCDYQDRGLVLFSAKNKQAKIRLYNTLRLLNSQSLYTAIAKRLTEEPDNMETVEINYIDTGDKIEVKDLGDGIARIVAEKLGGTDVDLRLGVRSAESRSDYNFSIRNQTDLTELLTDQSDEINIYSHNFSSYTLVNTIHIKALQENCEKKISYANFRPNLVVEGNPNADYNEQDIAKVKLSDGFHDVEFSIIRPWAHNNSINENTTTTPEQQLDEPYNILLKSQLLTTKYPCKWRRIRDVPVFGLNMEMNYDTIGKIGLLPGARVFVAFIDPENPPQKEMERNKSKKL